MMFYVNMKKCGMKLLEQVIKINDCAYIFEKGYYKIKVGSVKCDDDNDNIDLPLDKLIKFNAATISNRLPIEKDNKSFLEYYSEECLYEDIGLNINIKMVVKSLKIKNKSYYFWGDMVHLDDFDVKLVKVVRRESRIGVDIYYIGYVVNKPQYDIKSVNSLYLIVKHLFGRIEKIEISSDRYLVVDENNKEVINVFDKLWKFIEDEINS